MRVVRYYPRALVGDGGMTSAVRKWSQGMANHGAEAVIAYAEGVEPPAESTVEWIPVRHSGRTGMRVPVGLEGIVEGADVLVLHSGWTLHNYKAAAIARKLGIPYVLEPRGAYDPHIVGRRRYLKKPWWLALERRLVFGARAIHMFFEEERSHLEALGYRGPVIVASNGVDAPDDRWDRGSGGYVLWLGRFDPEHKGLDILLEAVRRLPATERPDLRLHGPDWHNRKRDVDDLVLRLGLRDHVVVGRSVYGTEKRRMLVHAKAFVYPSRWDACPNSVLEAVSLGIPSLVTPYPLGRFFAQRNAALLAKETPHALADGLVELGSEDAALVGEKGAEVTRAELSWDEVARQWLNQTGALL
ncbi:MAG: glycosyltransferase [Actinobacteria bacterium]|nr:glycosyltransferase [Actinomycetota bacterium]